MLMGFPRVVANVHYLAGCAEAAIAGAQGGPGRGGPLHVALGTSCRCA
jgi:hypothetical protein